MLCEINIVKNKLLIVSRIHYELIFKHNIAMFLFCFYCSLYFMIIQCTKLQCISKHNIIVGEFFFLYIYHVYTHSSLESFDIVMTTWNLELMRKDDLFLLKVV